ncbi:nucleoside 5-triphosphatase RdgB [Gracilibacillus boraciitolerans JCM 21714]|uniref:dITP/XTP pyrophosphatase n=1 Tax=Gracilibacillus boraciitolerans JCM 21714 TaxID=1298598 RepID=W4VHI6_9BACI|nr:XTP/dITP diphosphatase [Gracilibacillus boraciitolerans]GAE92667.1 nucleoside 5-triphosphatase RdgB [Gracilibacillus boraciitolerans JCM 21714]
MKELIIATKNPGKMKDFKGLFEPLGIRVSSLLDFPELVEDIEETGSTFEENAAIKAEAICEKFNLPVISDDSGIEIDALNGAPGVYSARYAGEEKDDLANLQKVLNELSDVPKEQRSGRFVCVLAIAQPDEKIILKRGECEGMIGFEAIGEYGFGYDPIFYPAGSSRTMAELTPEEKNNISHRRKALDKIEKWVKEL